MPKPLSRLLVVTDDKRWLKPTCSGLLAASKALDNPLGIVFLPVGSAQAALDLVVSDGDIQALLIDEALGNGAGDKALDARALVRAVHGRRPELDVYLMVRASRDEAQLAQWLKEPITGHFHWQESDYRGWFRILHAQLTQRSRTPFYDALKAYVAMAIDAWHTPGHSGGDSLRGSPWAGDFHDFMGEHAFRADLSVSVDQLDSLLDPKAVLMESQALAAQAFGARRTFFATNGTSTANKVIFQSLLIPGDKLLLDRNCHKSVHHGVVISGALPVYLDSSINPTYGVFGPVPKATLYRAIEDHPDAKAMVLTSCTYDGFCYDLAPIIERAHARGIKVIIDEAWFGHARFHPAFRPTALECGADYATQSTHKVLSAFSQASMIHVNDPDFDEHAFRENFNMHASTSPQYSMIASLDVARRQACMEGYKLLSRSLEMCSALRTGINATGVFRVLELKDLLPAAVRRDRVRLDPTKITVDISRSGLSAQDFQKELFEHYNIQVEKSTFNTVTFLVTIGTTRSKMVRLLDALQRMATVHHSPPKRSRRMPALAGFTQLTVLPRDAYYAQGELLPLLDENDRPNAALVGRVSADQIVPYPPGIPALVPGQLVTIEVLQFLLDMTRAHRRTEMHGMVFDADLPCMRVLTPAEARKLALQT